MRFILLVLFAVAENENTTLFATINFCVISLSLFGTTGGVYEKHWQSILEISFILNLGVFSAARLYLSVPNLGLAYVSVTIVVVTFIGIVALHIWKILGKKLAITKAIEKIKLIIEKKTEKKEEAVESTSCRTSSTN